LRTGRGSYTVRELKVIANNLGVDDRGRKMEIITNITNALSLI